jgi:L-threonylcarbamoyladenylate synthase
MRWPLKHAIFSLQQGGIIACPTEAIFGLSCDPLDAEAVYRLLALKHRPVEKGLILVASHFSQLEPYLLPLPTAARNRVLASWPGAHTWLWPANPAVPAWLTGIHHTLAVRVTAHPDLAALCRAFGGPLVSTSANLAGHRPQRTALGVRCQLGSRLDYILAGRTDRRASPTAIRDALTNRVIRPV